MNRVPVHRTRYLITALAASTISLLLAACGGSSGGGSGKETLPGASPDAVAVPDSIGTLSRVVTVADGLRSPWGLAFLANGDMLVTERGGTMRRLDAAGRAIGGAIANVPLVAARGQGGLLDVVVDPADPDPASPWVYWTFSEPGPDTAGGSPTAGTAVARGKLVGTTLDQVSIIFRQTPKLTGDNHYGSRIVFARDGTLFITLGERFQDDPSRPGIDHAQNLGKYLGKVVRINRDGTLASGNPTWPVAGALPHIWSMGHRNPQGAALHPVTGELWLHEHGAQGGDEVNIVRSGRNYGWPLRSYGCPYGAALPFENCRVNGGVHAPDFAEPQTYWAPSIAPSGMAFYTGTKLPGWQGNLFVGALRDQSLWRLTLQGDRVIARQQLSAGAYGRIRDVRQGPDGWLYLLTDDASNGKILRVEG